MVKLKLTQRPYAYCAIDRMPLIAIMASSVWCELDAACCAAGRPSFMRLIAIPALFALRLFRLFLIVARPAPAACGGRALQSADSYARAACAHAREGSIPYCYVFSASFSQAMLPACDTQ